MEENSSSPVNQSFRAAQILTRPNIDLNKLCAIEEIKNKVSEYADEVREQAEINIKYKGYIDKEKENVAKLHRLENIKIPENFDYSKVNSLSAEAKQNYLLYVRKQLHKQEELAGSPADINILLIFLGR